MSLFDVLDSPHSELVIGLVAPVGTESSIIIDEINDSLRAFGYAPIEIRLSNFLKEIRHGIPLEEEPEAARINSYMDAGDEVRRIMGRLNDPNGEEDSGGGALAYWAVAEIVRLRNHNPDEKKAFILRSLKHPEEARFLRRVYGDGFFLIAIYSPEEQRLEHLIRNRGIAVEDANRLIERDYNEEDIPQGQHTRETFHTADAFVSLTNKVEAREQIQRVIDLIFGNPFITPTLDEYAMFQAFTSALRSADLSRQVGAVILSKDNELIAVGANDVPTAGGGLYWPGEGDQRDYVWGIDSNAKRRNLILDDIVKVTKKLLEENLEEKENLLEDLRKKDSLLGKQPSTSLETKIEIPDDSPYKQITDKTNNSEKTEINEKELLKRVKQDLSKSILLDITEFGRPVHAEMEAILSCARTGTSTKNGTLFCTTFPCHNCAKHIVAAGLKHVVYVEPYPKSQAKDLHSDAIEIDEKACNDKVTFVPFVGIGARRFIDLFSMGLSSGYQLKRKKRQSIEKSEWKRDNAKIRIPMLRNSYLEREKVAQDLIEKLFEGGNDENKSETGHK